jgi:hypothetical protein
MFTASVLHEFQVTRVEYEDGVTNYWVHPETTEIKFCVSEYDLIKDINDTFYNPIFDTHPHHASELIFFDEKIGRVILDQNRSWLEHGISENIHVLRVRPNLFKPAPAA